MLYVCMCITCEYTSICIHVLGRPEVDVMCLFQLFFNVFMEEESHTEPILTDSTVYWSKESTCPGIPCVYPHNLGL